MNLSYVANSVTKHLMRAQFCQAFWQLNRKYRTMITCDLFKSLSLFICVSVQFSSVQLLSRVRLCNPMNRSTPGLPVHHQLQEFTQTHVHWVSDAIQPSYPLSSPSPPALSLSQNQGLLKWVSSSHQMAKVLEFQLHYLYILTTMYIYVHVYRYIKPLIYLHNYNNIYVNYMPVILMPS